MASLLTNASALSALQTLSQTQRDLTTTQNRISSGLRVADASDNAVYWSIATTMKSDNNALSAVKDSLNLGASTLDVASAALNSSKDVLDKIKVDLVAAAQPGADRAKIQLDITQLQRQLQSISASASFNGQNWLSQDSSMASYNATKGIVASFSRDSAGAVSVGTIDINTTTVKLYDAAGATERSFVGAVQSAAAAFKADAALIITLRNAATTLEGTDNAANRVALDTAITKLGTMDTGSAVRSAFINYTTALDTTTGVAAAKTALDTAISAVVSPQTTALTNAVNALNGAGYDTVSVKTTFTAFNTDLTAAFSGAGAFSTTNQTAFNTALTSLASLYDSKSGILDKISATTGASIATLSIASLTDSAFDTGKLADLTKQVDAAIKSITDAASTLGATKTRINLQSTFVSALQESITKGVGSLVDADMNEESTRLQALQVQQQLGVQSLGIANQNSQLILKLFAG